jgi:hypothetical protein
MNDFDNYERHTAIREGHFNQASDEYFEARPQIDSAANRRVFYAGHCKGYDTATEPLVKQIEELQKHLRFVERWANHHTRKENTSAEEALSCIQHYPAIRAITFGYADGVMPTTPNPWKQIESDAEELAALRAKVAEFEAQNARERADW